MVKSLKGRRKSLVIENRRDNTRKLEDQYKRSSIQIIKVPEKKRETTKKNASLKKQLKRIFNS